MGAFAYHDLMYGDLRPGIDVRATLTLFDSVQSGRISRPGLRWRPNHNFGSPEGRTFYIGQVEFDSVEAIQPGETERVLVRFLDGPRLRDNLQPGRTWRIQEGPTWVGTATVIEILA